MDTGIAASRDGAAAVSGAVWLRSGCSWRPGRRSGSYDSPMEATTTIQCEHDLPLPVRVELRELEHDLLEGRLTPAEYDALVDELLVALGVPVAEAGD